MRKFVFYKIICLVLLTVNISSADNPCNLCPPASPEMVFFKKAEVVFIGLATNANIQYDLNQFNYDPTQEDSNQQSYKLNAKFKVHTLIKGNINTSVPYYFKIEYNGVCDYTKPVQQNKLYIVQARYQYGELVPIQCNSFILYDSEEGAQYVQTIFDILSGKVTKGEGFMDGYLINWSLIRGELVETNKKNIHGL